MLFGSRLQNSGIATDEQPTERSHLGRTLTHGLPFRREGQRVRQHWRRRTTVFQRDQQGMPLLWVDKCILHF